MCKHLLLIGLAGFSSIGSAQEHDPFAHLNPMSKAPKSSAAATEEDPGHEKLLRSMEPVAPTQDDPAVMRPILSAELCDIYKARREMDSNRESWRRSPVGHGLHKLRREHYLYEMGPSSGLFADREKEVKRLLREEVHAKALACGSPTVKKLLKCQAAEDKLIEDACSDVSDLMKLHDKVVNLLP